MMNSNREPMGAIVIETERLALRDLRIEDLDELAALYADPRVRQYFPDGTLTRSQTLKELE